MSRESTHAFRLSFDTGVCIRCGTGRRVLGAACPECGDKGRLHEVNGAVVRRRQALAWVASEVASADEPASTEPLPIYKTKNFLLSSTVDLLDEMLQSLSGALSDPTSTSSRRRLARAICALRERERYLNSVETRRPFVAFLNALREVLADFDQMSSAYIEAATASTMGDAQTYAARAQSHIDAASAKIDQLNRDQRVADAFGSLTDDEDLFDKSVEAVDLKFPGLGIVNADSAGLLQVKSLLEQPVAGGTGTAYIVAKMVADVYLDSARLDNAIRSASRLLVNIDTSLPLFSSRAALDDLATAKTGLYEAIKIFSLTIESSQTDEAVVRRLVRLYADVFEEVGLPLFGWYLLMTETRSQAYEKLRLENSTSLAKSILANADLLEVFAGADKNLRTAASHGKSFTVEKDQMVFNLKSFNGTIGLDVLLDTMLAFFESLIAAQVVLDNQLSNLGISGNNPADLSAIGINLASVFAEVLRSQGNVVKKVESSNGEWTFELTARSSSSVTLASVLASAEIPKLSSVVIIDLSAAVGNLEIELKSYKKFASLADKGGLELLEGSITLLNECTLDGGSALRLDHMRYATACVALSLLNEEDSRFVPFLARFLRLARHAHFDDVEVCASRALNNWRNPAPRSTENIRSEYAHWLDLPIPELPETRFTKILIGSERSNTH